MKLGCIMSKHVNSRRKFIKAAIYTAPVVMTLKAAPSFAKSGSHMSDISCDTDFSKDTVSCKSSVVDHTFNIPQTKSGFQKFIASFLKIFGF